MNVCRRIVSTIGLIFGAALVMLVVMTSAASADPGDYGTEGPSFASRPSGTVSEKPQSRLWHRDGQWFGVLWSDSAGSWNIFKLNGATNQWSDTGVVVESRANTSADALWDGTHLYVASHVVNVSSDTFPNPADAGQPARLSRYSYSSGSGSFTLDAGFPTNITDFSSETLTIAKDSVGQIWATWTQVGPGSGGYATKVYVNSTSGDDRTWGVPYVPPVSGVNVEPDDISAITSFGGNRIGVIWSNQADEVVYWAEHVDGAAAGSWSGAIASSGNNIADDHLNLKSLQSDSQGRVYAAVKTSLDSSGGSQPQMHLLVLQPSTGSWTTSLFGTVSDCHTRPLVVLDETNQVVHMFATGPSSSGCPWSGYPGSIYGKSAPMGNPVFAPGRGTPILRDATDDAMNDVSSTKQAVNTASGLIIVGSNYDTDRYWTASVPLGPASPGSSAPVAAFTPSVVSGVSPLAVTFTDTSTNSPTSWNWDFGDGASSTLQNPQHTYSSPGQYAATLVASNASGPSSPVSVTISVNQPGGNGLPSASFSVSTSSGTAPLSVSFTDASSGGATSWAWTFGDGSTSSAQNPSHVFTAAGTYTVSLVASNATGSSAPATSVVTVTTGGSSGTGVTVGGSSSAESSGSSVVSLAKPAGLADGDVLIAQITSNNAPNMSSVPAGWVELTPPVSLSGQARVFVYYRVVGNAAGEPSSWSWQLASSQKWGAGLTAFSGVDGGSPFDSAVATGSSSSSSISVPGVSVSTAGALLVGGVGIDSGGATLSPPSGWTEAWESGQQRAELAYRAGVGTGASGSVSWALSYGVPSKAWMVALKPLDAGAPVDPVDPVPSASFTSSVSSGVAPLSVSFSDTSSGGATSWAWTFGDGSTSSAQNPSHVFTAAGTYTVSLVASNATGPSAPATSVVTVTAPPAGPTVVVGGSSAAESAGSSTVSLAKPAGLADGDVVIAQITTNNAPNMSSVPAGWVELTPPVSMSGNARVFVYYLVVDTAASEPASWSWQLSASQKWGAGLTAFSGVDGGSPFDSAVSTAAGSGSSVSVPGVSVSTAGAMLVGGVGIDSGLATVSPPSGWTEAWESSQQGAELAHLANPAMGDTGTVAWSTSYAVPSRGWMVALKPFDPNAPVDPVPSASFTSSVSSGVAPLSVSFSDTSSGGATSWAWTFGDGSTSSAQNPSHVFTAAGTYTVSLVASNATGPSAPATSVVTVTAPPAGSGIVVGGSSSDESSGSSVVSLAKPAGLADGDVVIAQITSNNAPNMSSVPAGWVELTPPVSMSGQARVFVYYLVVDTAASEPASWSWQLSASQKWGAGLTAFSGVDGGSPFDSAVVTGSASGSSVSVSGVSVSTAGAMLVGGVGIDSGGATLSPPSGWTEAWESGQQRAELAYQADAGTGATGSVSWSLSYGVPSRAWMVALKPA